MNPDYLDFEQPIAELKSKIEELQLVGSHNSLDMAAEIATLKEKCRQLTVSIFDNLSEWQVAQLARHAADNSLVVAKVTIAVQLIKIPQTHPCLLYTSDAADE